MIAPAHRQWAEDMFRWFPDTDWRAKELWDYWQHLEQQPKVNMTTKKAKRAADKIFRKSEPARCSPTQATLESVFGAKVRKPTEAKPIFMAMVAPDRRLFYFIGKKNKFYAHIKARNNEISWSVQQGYNNLADLWEEAVRLWPHLAIKDDGINDA